MCKSYDWLVNEMVETYHEQIHNNVSFNELGEFLTDFLDKYKEKHPYKKPSVSYIDDTEIFDPGDWEGV